MSSFEKLLIQITKADMKYMEFSLSIPDFSRIKGLRVGQNRVITRPNWFNARLVHLSVRGEEDVLLSEGTEIEFRVIRELPNA